MPLRSTMPPNALYFTLATRSEHNLFILIFQIENLIPNVQPEKGDKL